MKEMIREAKDDKKKMRKEDEKRMRKGRKDDRGDQESRG